MSVETEVCSYCNNSGRFNGTITPLRDGADVPPKERRDTVLDFIAEHDMPLPPTAIFGGLSRQRNIHFGYSTVQNCLSDLLESGDLVRVDTGVLRKEGKIQAISDSGNSRRSYYWVTDKGRDRLDEIRTSGDLDATDLERDE